MKKIFFFLNLIFIILFTNVKADENNKCKTDIVLGEDSVNCTIDGISKKIAVVELQPAFNSFLLIVNHYTEIGDTITTLIYQSALENQTLYDRVCVKRKNKINMFIWCEAVAEGFPDILFTESDYINAKYLFDLIIEKYFEL